MPELSRFEGMIIKMLFNDTVQHNKPHVHVYYGEYQAAVGIDGELLAGSLPYKQLKMVIGWLALHEEEAYAANCIWVNDTVIVPEGYPAVLEAVKSCGYKVLLVDTSEYRKLDGGLSCLSLRF